MGGYLAVHSHYLMKQCAVRRARNTEVLVMGGYLVQKKKEESTMGKFCMVVLLCFIVRSAGNDPSAITRSFIWVTHNVI
jgi:hypothetical protein